MRNTIECSASLLAAAAIGFSGGVLAQSVQTATPGGAINDNLGDPDYGVCRGIDPKCFHDWPRPKTNEYKVLLYTRTAGPRHADLGTPLAAGLNPPLDASNVVQREMLRLMTQNGIKLDYTEDASVMTRVASYHAVIFFSTSRDNLDDAGKTALRQYMRAGGAFVGIHNAFGTLYNWPYFEGLLGNANFYDHGPFREGDVVIVDSNDASTQGLPARWHFKDEWYNLVPFPTRVRFLATVDEKSWTPVREGEGERPFAPTPGASGAAPNQPRPPGLSGGFVPVPSVVGRHPGHGSFHPVAWCQYYDGGKVWVTTLGHDASDFADDDSKFPGAVEFQKLIVGGIQSVIGIKPFCR